MGFQFVHVEAYSRRASTKVSNRKAKAAKQVGRVAVSERRSMREVIAEAEREPGNHPHVSVPQPPVLLHGVMPCQVEAEALAWCKQNRDAKGRTMRADGLCLAAGVVSVPADLSPQQWIDFKRDALAWLRDQYGDCLRSVVEHTDEPHPHLHFYVVPRPGERFESIDLGRAAAKEAAEAGQVKGEQNRAYKQAMRHWQDSFFNSVAVMHGLTRVGPRRRRLSRSEWWAEQQVARAVVLARERADQVEKDLVEQAQEKAKQVVAQHDHAVAVTAEIERRAQAVKDGRKALKLERAAIATERRELAESRRRWERAGAKVGVVVAAVREAITGPVRKLRARIEALQHEQAGAIKAAAAEGLAKGRAESERERADLRRDLRARDADLSSLRRQLGVPEDGAGHRHAVKAQPGRFKKTV